jgi:type IV pilus assembly protein PilV
MMIPLSSAGVGRQRGSFLLEALIAILIVALGVLGSVGLLARSMQDIDDAKFRGEAAYLANSLIGQMWLDDRATASLDAKYGSATAGPGYVEFQTLVQQRMPQAIDPVVTVAAGPTATSSIVTVVIQWHMPGDKTGTPDHVHRSMATIGANL